ncbi:MAG: glycerophosphodiester phosphodiesterase [Microbacteriaceae bacterium]|nr:glycerophosphodiester phosphodiesterase [Microbacteriaceae bacterium]
MTFRAAEHPYFAGRAPRVLAHRGLHNDDPENSMSAFQAAVDAGVTFIETDVVGSKDGVAMISHDTTLDRVSDRSGPVGALTAAELAEVDLGGEGFITLPQALERFPLTRFNIDVKDGAAIDGVVSAVRDAGASDRVLLTSFSTARRLAITKRIPGAASSPSATEFLILATAIRMGFTPPLPLIHALQIPERANRMTFVTEQLVDRYHRAGLEVHVWTVNDEATMRRLLAIGVDGIVTDRADLALRVLDS